VVATQPDFREVAELLVRRDLIGRQMAVVIVDRLRLRLSMVKQASPLGGEQKVFVQKRGGDGHGEEL